MSHTRPDGSLEEPVDTRMVEVRPHVYVAEDYARANGMSRLIPTRSKSGRAEAKRK